MQPIHPLCPYQEATRQGILPCRHAPTPQEMTPVHLPCVASSREQIGENTAAVVCICCRRKLHFLGDAGAWLCGKKEKAGQLTHAKYPTRVASWGRYPLLMGCVYVCVCVCMYGGRYNVRRGRAIFGGQLIVLREEEEVHDDSHYQ